MSKEPAKRERGAGRPQRGTGKVVRSVVATAEEWAEIDAAAEKASMSRSEYLRYAALERARRSKG